MKLLLILSTGDWGDEFELEGWAVYPKEWWEEYKASISEDSNLEFYYGSNESCTFENKEDYLDHFTEKEITQEEYETLCNLLNQKPVDFTQGYYQQYKRGHTYGLFLD